MIQREVGVLPQEVGVVAVDAVNHAAHRDLRDDGVAVAIERLAHRPHERIGDRDEVAVRPAAVGQDREFVAAEAVGRVRHHAGESAGDFLDKPVADDVTHRVVGDLQIVDIDDQKAERRIVGDDALEHRVVEAAPVRQAGELIEIGQRMIAALRFVVLDGDRKQMHAGIDDRALEFGRAALGAIVEAEGRRDTAIARLDRARPARHEADRQDQVFIRSPQRIGRHVIDFDRLAQIGRSAAGADIRPDRKAGDEPRLEHCAD